MNAAYRYGLKIASPYRIPGKPLEHLAPLPYADVLNPENLFMRGENGALGGIRHANEWYRNWRNKLLDDGHLPRTVVSQTPGALAAAKRWLFGDH